MIARTVFAAALIAASPLLAQDTETDRGSAAEGFATFEPTDAEAALFADSTITGTTGEEVYGNVCAGCHMPDGSGAVGAGAYPALAGNPNLEYPEYAISLIVNGQRGMPVLGDLLSDEQIVEVVNYIQSELGNDYEPTATIEAVEAVRPVADDEGIPKEHE